MTGFEAILNLFLHFFTIINKLTIATLVPLRDSTHPCPFPRKGRKSFLPNEGGLKVGAIPQGEIFFYKKNPPSAQDVSP